MSKKVLLIGLRKFTLLALGLMLTLQVAQAQDDKATAATLKAKKAELEAQVATLSGEIASLSDQIDKLPGWHLGSFGTIGVNFSQFNNWLGRGNADANTFTGVIGTNLNGFAHLMQDKYFWRNTASINLGWTKLAQNKEQRDQNDFEKTTDAFVANSLYGYKLTEKFAISAMGEYRTTVLSNFNNPGYLDLGVGGTWTPITDLVVVIHPLNYNIVFADDDVAYSSSLGCKIMADYTRKLNLLNGISWKSNLSAFLSYKDIPNLSNWTWVNGFAFTAWKGIGVGFELGLRGNRQEHLGSIRNAIEEIPTTEDFTAEAKTAVLEATTFDGLDGLFTPAADASDGIKSTSTTLKESGFESSSPLQTYWLIGLTYTL